MNGPAKLLASEDRWVSRMGGWFPGERVVFRGKDLHADLNDLSWMELYLFGITGRRFTPVEVRILNAIWVYTSYPDPRIWNNRVAALAGTARSTGALGISAALAVSEATTYGHRAALRAFDFFQRARILQEDGIALGECVGQEIRKHKYVYGFGRPIVKSDERIAHLMRLVRKIQFDQKPFVRMAFDVEALLQHRNPELRMNYAALNAALLADMGFTARQFHFFRIPLFLAGMLPCFIDTMEKPEGSFFPLRCDRIAYEGVPQRRWE